MAVGGAQALKESDGVRERLDTLNRAIRHVDRRLAGTADLGHVDALGHEVADQGVVPTGRSVVDGVIAVMVTGVNVGTEFFD